MGRHPGRKYYPRNLMFTKEQNDYLDSQPNASELMRFLLDIHMASPHAEKDLLEAEVGRVLYEHHILTKSKQFLESITGSTSNGRPMWKEDADHRVIETYDNLEQRYNKAMRRLRELEKI